jgi:Penicillin-insensitive murein endopeptidase
MGWQPGEIWFDADIVWSRECSSASAAAASAAIHEPSFFGLPPAGLPYVAAPNGLAASRSRRAERRRRQEAKKTWAAALVLAPTVLLTATGERLGIARGQPPTLDEDPPSLTFRPGLAENPVRPPGRATHLNRLTDQGRRPRIAWHRATARGLPYAGSLVSGTQLPVEGPDWVTWDPVHDRVPNEPQRLFGTEDTIRTVVSVIASYRSAHPDAPRVVIGDISFRGGGRMEEHRSHQNGLDVDVYYPRLDRALRAPRTTAQVDRRLSQALLDRFVAAGAEIVFVGYRVGLRGPRGIVTPYPNHENHMHVRFLPRR